MFLNLGDDYSILSQEQGSVISIHIKHKSQIIGKATLVTDHVDVACITHLEISDEHVNHTFKNQKSLGEAFLKFLTKYPKNIRKVEFRFVLEFPENLKSLLENKKFTLSSSTKEADQVLIRKDKCLPVLPSKSHEFKICEQVSDAVFESVLPMMKQSAYWRVNSSNQTLTTFTKHSRCFYVVLKDKVIGFARVLTDGVKFASLWDVTVAQAYQKQGVGTALMHHIFSDEKLKNMPHWILFTDTAKSFYQKLGFVSQTEIPKSSTMLHKLRIQKNEPSYLPNLHKAVCNTLPENLTPEQSHQFLFSSDGKRAKLTEFWKSVPTPTPSNKVEEAPQTKAFSY